MVGESIMSRVPTEQMKKAMKEILITNINEKAFGKDKEHKIYYAYDVNEDIHSFMYTHYGTACLYVEDNHSLDEQLVYIYSGAYSCTDRDNMNGMLYMLDIDRVRVYKDHDNLYFKIDGKKTKLRKIVIE